MKVLVNYDEEALNITKQISDFFDYDEELYYYINMILKLKILENIFWWIAMIVFGAMVIVSRYIHVARYTKSQVILGCLAIFIMAVIGYCAMKFLVFFIRRSELELFHRFSHDQLFAYHLLNDRGDRYDTSIKVSTSKKGKAIIEFKKSYHLKLNEFTVIGPDGLVAGVDLITKKIYTEGAL